MEAQQLVVSGYCNSGTPTSEHVTFQSCPMPSELEDGDVLIQTTYISVDPYMVSTII